MNYLKEITSFTDWLMWNPLPTSAIALWYQLMAVNNKCLWVNEFTVANLQLQSLTGLSRQGLDLARNVLIQRGRINYKKMAGNQAGKYRMIPFDGNIIGTNVGTKADANPAQTDTQKHTPARHNTSTLYKQETKSKTETKQNSSIEELERALSEKKESGFVPPPDSSKNNAPPDSARPPKKANQSKLGLLFSETEFNDREVFIAAFAGSDYEYADLNYYHEVIKNWSDGGGNRKKDWIATAKNWMLKDSQDKKIKLRNGTRAKQPGTGISDADLVEAVRNYSAAGH